MDLFIAFAVIDKECSYRCRPYHMLDLAGINDRLNITDLSTSIVCRLL